MTENINNNNKFKSKFKISTGTLLQHQLVQQETSNFKTNNKVYQLGNDKLILIFKENESIYFHGSILARSIIGSVYCYGYKITPLNNSYYPIYAPFCSPTLSISTNLQNSNSNTSSTSTSYSFTDITSSTSAYKIPELVKNKLIENKESILSSLTDTNGMISSIIVLKVLDDNCENSKMFTKKKIELIDAFKLLRGFYPLYSPDWNMQQLSIPTEWLQLINDQFLNGSDGSDGEGKGLSILTCGERNVGKSTFNRILINQLLLKYSNLIYIETDTGQTEFTPSGIMSIDIINSPLLGPPFTHCKFNPLKSYFYGDTSPKSNPEYFLNLSFQLIECCNQIRKQYPSIPVLLNTNGWLKSLGLHLTQEIIKQLSPSSIVQLYQPTNNTIGNQYDSNVTFTQQDINQLFEDTDGSDEKVSPTPPTLYSIYGVNNYNNETQSIIRPLYNLGSFETRNLMMRKYFKIESNGQLTHQSPYQVSWKELKVKILTNEVTSSQTMYALNASLIGICIDPIIGYKYISYKVGNKLPTLINKQPQISQCIGIGLIRSIDMTNGYFYIITPIDPTLLQQANTILKGSIEIPTTLTISISSKGKIQVPYLQLDVLSSYGTGSDVMNRPKNFENNS